MPIVEHSAWAPVTTKEAFDLSMSHARRFDWDPFVNLGRDIRRRVDTFAAALTNGMRAAP